MSRKWKVSIGIIAVVMIVAGVLRWGSVVYRNSDGERGWSLGAAVYELLGWGSEAYRADFHERVVYDEDADEGVSLRVADRRFGHWFGVGREGHFGPAGFVGGLVRLAFLALVVGLVVVFFHRRRRKIQHS